MKCIYPKYYTDEDGNVRVSDFDVSKKEFYMQTCAHFVRGDVFNAALMQSAKDEQSYPFRIVIDSTHTFEVGCRDGVFIVQTDDPATGARYSVYGDEAEVTDIIAANGTESFVNRITLLNGTPISIFDIGGRTWVRGETGEWMEAA